MPAQQQHIGRKTEHGKGQHEYVQRALSDIHAKSEQSRKTAQPEHDVEYRIGLQASAEYAEDIVYKPYTYAHGRRADKLKKLAGYIKLHLSEKLRPEAARRGLLLVAQIAYKPLYP